MPRKPILETEKYSKILSCIDLGINTPTQIKTILEEFNVETILMNLKNIDGSKSDLYNFVTKTKISKATYYKINVVGFIQYIVNNIFEIKNKKINPEIISQNRRINNVFAIYLKSSLKICQESDRYITIKELIHNFIVGIGMSHYKYHETIGEHLDKGIINKLIKPQKKKSDEDFVAIQIFKGHCLHYFEKTLEENSFKNIASQLYKTKLS